VKAAEEARQKLEAVYASLSASFEAQQEQLDTYSQQQAAAGKLPPPSGHSLFPHSEAASIQSSLCTLLRLSNQSLKACQSSFIATAKSFCMRCTPESLS
jgi:hypothetical protein